jgi:two-component system OmpR family response regulator
MAMPELKNPSLQSVLYVDDEPDIREVVEMALSLVATIAVKTCGSGAEALRLLPGLMPDLVLLDVMMPGLDGPATLAKMRGDPALSRIPVVFMTAKALPQEVDRFMSLGAVGVISKPFDPMQLAKRVEEIWRSVV